MIKISDLINWRMNDNKIDWVTQYEYEKETDILGK